MKGKFTSRTSWRAKLEKVQEARVGDIPPRMAVRFGPGRMLIPRPLDVDALIRKVKRGKLVTPAVIRDKLARDHNVDVTCPLCTGIFIRIAAETAEEDRRLGRTRITPYWRVVRDDGSLNDKLPGGTQSQSKRLREEGHTVIPGNGRKGPKVEGLEKRLIRF